jgi:hypothetical protein
MKIATFAKPETVMGYYTTTEMKKTLIILNIVALIASLIWLMTDRSLEPLISTIGLIASLITLLYNSDKSSGISMKQKGGKKSTNYQAGDTINVKMKNDKR